jgi:L-fuconolactonase
MIDSHQHFWTFNINRDVWITEDMGRIRRNFYPSDATNLFFDNGINGCVAVQADSSEDETIFLISLAEQSEFIKGVVGWVDLQSKNVESRLTYFSQFEQIVGFRHVVQAERDPEFLSRSDFLKGIQLLETFDFSYDLLIYPNQLNSGIEFCKKNPNQRIVLDHLAKPPIRTGNVSEWKKYIQKFKNLTHVSAKISGLITEAEWYAWNENDILNIIEISLEVFGPDRLMFGTDYPVVLVAEELSTWVQTFNKSIAQLSSEEIRKITVDNCLQFYKIELS